MNKNNKQTQLINQNKKEIKKPNIKHTKKTKNHITNQIKNTQ